MSLCEHRQAAARSIVNHRRHKNPYHADIELKLVVYFLRDYLSMGTYWYIGGLILVHEALENFVFPDYM